MKRRIYTLLKKGADNVVRLVNSKLPWKQADAEELLLPACTPYRPALPQNSAQLPARLAAVFEEEIALPAVHLFTVRQVSISWHAVVFRNLRVLLASLAHPRELVHYSDTYLLKEWIGEKVRVADGQPAIALVHNQWTTGNYYHWIVDSLPKLALLQRRHADCQLVMPAPVPAFVQESAAMLGFTKLLPLRQNQALVGVDLLLPEQVTPPGFQRPEILQLVRLHLLRAAYKGAPLPRAHRRVYVSRRLQRVRRLLNEDAIEDLLAQYGYEIVEFERLSFIEQIKLMSETERLIGIHGAGLTNILFLPPTARVAELLNEDKLVYNHPDNFENLIYFRMADALKLPYYCLPCTGAEPQPLLNDAHLHVDKAAFAQLLQLLDE